MGDGIVTIGIEVWAEYTCSACGKENKLPDEAKITGTTASILALRRAGKDRDLGALLPGGVAKAGLRCRCGCGHREPWARMNGAALDKARNILLALLALAAAALYLLHSGETAPVALLLGAAALCALGAGGIALYKHLLGRKIRKELDALPARSLPRLSLRKPPEGR